MTRHATTSPIAWLLAFTAEAAAATGRDRLELLALLETLFALVVERTRAADAAGLVEFDVQITDDEAAPVGAICVAVAKRRAARPAEVFAEVLLTAATYATVPRGTRK